MSDGHQTIEFQPLPPPPIPINVVATERGAPKDPSEYQIGDDIRDYLYSESNHVYTNPAEFKIAEDEIRAAEKSSMETLLRFLESLCLLGEKKNEIVLQITKIESLQQIADSIRDRREAAKSQPGISRQISASSSPEASCIMGSDARKNRMQGVDVSSLPAGFGKRRSSAGGSFGSKRPIPVPAEGAPEVKKLTPVESPEN